MQNTIKLPPFKRLCVTIGNLPTSQVESMSYYEAILWLSHYLETVVIPAVNNNADAVEELQDLFTQLQAFVNNYFDNLDVQEEINNKLDDMVEAGTLQEIISEYLNSTAVFGFDTVNDMKEATNLINGSFARTLGYYSVNDGGAGLYKIRTVTNEDTENDGDIIALNDITLVAELISTETNVKQFGAKGDGTTDDTTAIQTAINYCIANNKKLIIDKDTYYISSTLTINSDNVDIQCDGTITSDLDIVYITYNGLNSNIYINKMTNTGEGYLGTAFLSNTKMSGVNLKINYIHGFNKGISFDTSNATNPFGIFYNYIYNDFIEAHYSIYLNANTSFINANYFYLGHVSGNTGIYSVAISSTGEYNGNIFYNVGFELITKCIELNNFNRNTFENFRIMESVSGSKFITLINCENNVFRSNDISAILQNSTIEDNTTRDKANVFDCLITQYGSLTSDYSRKALSYNNKFEVIENGTLPNSVTLANDTFNLSDQSSLNAINNIVTYNSEADTIFYLDDKYNHDNLYSDLTLYVAYIAGNHNIQVFDSNNNKIFDLDDFRSSGIVAGKAAYFKFDLFGDTLIPHLVYYTT